MRLKTKNVSDAELKKLRSIQFHLTYLGETCQTREFKFDKNLQNHAEDATKHQKFGGNSLGV